MKKLLFLRQPPTKFLRITPIAADPDRHGIAAVAMVRNEAHYIADWARFHLAAGIRHLIVYENGPGDGTAEALRAAVPAERVTIHPWAGGLTDMATGMIVNRQVLAHAHAVLNHGRHYARMAFIDADEFLVPTDGPPDIMSSVAAIGDHPVISLPWTMFGADGHDTRPDMPVWDAYRRRAAHPQGVIRNFKCIADPARLVTVSVHAFETDSHGWTMMAPDGRVGDLDARRKDDGFLVSGHLQLNHYYTRSRSEFEAKIARGPSSSDDLRTTYAARLRKGWRLIHGDVTEDRAILDFLARALPPGQSTADPPMQGDGPA